MTAQSYNASPVTTYPAIMTSDSGIHAVDRITDIQFRVWYTQDGKKQYVRLPKGTTIENARAYRDDLYERLQRQGATEVATRVRKSSGKRTPVSLKDRKLITRVPEHYVVYFRGKYVGTGRTREIAEKKLAAWIAEVGA